MASSPSLPRFPLREPEDRVLVAAQASRDGARVQCVLTRAGISVVTCSEGDSLFDEIARGVCAVVVTNDFLDTVSRTRLAEVLGNQAVWSDLPFVVLANGAASPRLRRLQAIARVTVLDRTAPPRTLVHAVQTAVRARGRQYRIRDLLDSERTAREKADRAKDQFLAALSHELRTPLTPIVFAIAMLQQDAGSSASSRRALEMIRRNVALETRLIDDLIDLNRVVKGRLQLQTAAVDVHQTIRDTLEALESDARAKGVTIDATLDAGAFHVQGDAARIHQVFLNVIRNAIKFTPTGGAIVVETRNQDRALVIACRDEGIGMSADAVTRIFEPFEQGTAEVSRQFGGLGLGLAVSRALVVAHGGALTAASPGPGRGSTFSITLPRAWREESVPAGASDLAASAEALRRPLKILLVEDHIDTADALSESLTARGHRVRLVHCVADALRSLAADDYELIISDIGLPDGSGLDLVRQIHHRPSLGAIAVSGFGTDEDVARSRDAGFDRHLTKPVDFAQLDRTIGELSAACPAA